MLQHCAVPGSQHVPALSMHVPAPSMCRLPACAGSQHACAGSQHVPAPSMCRLSACAGSQHASSQHGTAAATHRPVEVGCAGRRRSSHLLSQHAAVGAAHQLQGLLGVGSLLLQEAPAVWCVSSCGTLATSACVNWLLLNARLAARAEVGRVDPNACMLLMMGSCLPELSASQPCCCMCELHAAAGSVDAGCWLWQPGLAPLLQPHLELLPVLTGPDGV
jgi:hypothetical protein